MAAAAGAAMAMGGGQGGAWIAREARALEVETEGAEPEAERLEGGDAEVDELGLLAVGEA